MEIKLNKKKYTLDTEAALAAGLLKEQTFKVELTESEIAALQFVLGNVGGTHDGGRGFTASVWKKLYDACRNPQCDKPLQLDGTAEYVNRIYLK